MAIKIALCTIRRMHFVRCTYFVPSFNIFLAAIYAWFFASVELSLAPCILYGDEYLNISKFCLKNEDHSVAKN